MEEIKSRVLEVIRRVFNLHDLTLDEELLKEGNIEGWDSLGHLNLLMELEREFNVKFSLDDIERSRTFDDITALIEGKLNERKT
jgi:acyl carrier protein